MSEKFHNGIDPEIWKRALLVETGTIKNAINILEQTALKIVLVVNQSGKLLGTISDGDIRRGLIRGLVLDNPIESIVCKEPIVVEPSISRVDLFDLMIKHKIYQIPVVDGHRNIVGLYLRDLLEKKVVRENCMIVMAGGKGMRLRPYTQNTPKPLLVIQGRPILEHILMRAIDEGFRSFIFSINYLGEQIEDYFGNGEKYGVKINYLKENHELGTAGSLSLLNTRPTAPFIVSNGDVLTDLKYGTFLDFHLKQNAHATMALRSYEWQNPYGVVHTSGFDIVGFEEKPVNKSNINAGIYALNPGVLDYLNYASFCDMPEIFERIQSNGGRVMGYPIHENWADIGRVEIFHQFK